MKSQVLITTLKAFDLPGRVGVLCLELGGVPVPEERRGWTPSWELSTRHGWLCVMPDRGEVVCRFADPARAYAKLADVRYPGGQWFFRPKTRLSDASGPQEVVQSLSEILARLTKQLKDIALPVEKGLTTAVVGETKAPMPGSRTRK